MKSKQIRHTVGVLSRNQCGKKDSRRDLVKDALSFPASWSQQTGLGPRDAFETIDAKLLSALFLNVSLCLIDDGR